jgi:iron(III) transport system ATP-binding protein
VTHDQAEAVVLGDRIGVMRDGKLLQIASPNEIYNRPADLFVANFTGASNALSGRLVERNGEFGTVETRSGNRLTAWLPPGVAAGNDVNVALRPENIRLGVQGTNEPNHFTARVTGQRYQGTQTVYELATLGAELEALELGTSVRYPVGTDVEISLPPGLCWAYSARETVASD